jgi:hypothetical protein
LLDGDTITLLTPQRHMDVIVPLPSTLLSSKEAGQLAELHDPWQPHPARDEQPMAFVKGGDHMWERWDVPRNACVIRE